MKTIKIFLASSEELANDRNAFGNLVRRLDRIYENRGIRIDLFPWEDHDAAYNNRRKQDEYNDEVRASDMFLVLFYKKAGQFTIEEFNVATEEFRRTGINPKIYVYCRKLETGEKECDELREFKKHLFEEMGHYWSNYDNSDSMQLHFVMQLQLVENSRLDELKVENGEVRLADMIIARMENLRFAVDNPDYQRMSQRLADLPQEIEDARLLIKDHPDIERYQNKLQNLLEERNRLQKEFNQQQDLILNTAKRIATLQGEVITSRMRRAIEAFERGDVRDANVILDDEEKDGDAIFADFEKMEEIRDIKINNIHSGIESLLLQTTTVMAEGAIPIQERIDRTIELYKKADYRASRTEYNKKKYSNLLFDYAKFLFVYGYYTESIDIYLRLIEMLEVETAYMARLYNNVGLAFKSLNDYSHALEYYEKALGLFDNLGENNHLSYAMTLNNIGNVYQSQKKYAEALNCQFESLSIIQKKLGKKHPFIAQQLNNIGNVYLCTEEYSKALSYYFPALSIYEATIGPEHIETATLYNNMGSIFLKIGDSNKALMYYEKALEIREEKLGRNHPDTVISYKNIGDFYGQRGYGYVYSSNDETSRCSNAGFYFECLSDISRNDIDYYEISINYLQKALKSHEANESVNNVLSQELKDSITEITTRKEVENNQALAYYKKALRNSEKLHGVNSCEVADVNFKIGRVLSNMGDYENALLYYQKVLEIFEKIFGIDHFFVAEIHERINSTKERLIQKNNKV